MKIKSIILECPACKKDTITSNFALIATSEALTDQDNSLRPRILLMIHCEFCDKKYQSKLDSVDFVQIG